MPLMSLTLLLYLRPPGRPLFLHQKVALVRFGGAYSAHSMGQLMSGCELPSRKRPARFLVGPTSALICRQASTSGFRDRPSIAIPGTRYLNTPRFFASSTISTLIIGMIL